jgi:hypothetical protein
MRKLNEDIKRIQSLMMVVEGEHKFPTKENQIIEKFKSFVKQKLGIKNDIPVRFQNDKEEIKTTAVYQYKDGETENFDDTLIRVYVKDRALVDVLRSLAHEMVHHSQNEKKKLKGKITNVGGTIENEANIKAADLVKEFGTNNPEIYGNKQGEFSEQEDGGGDDSAPSEPTMDKWETGLSRGPANQVGNTKWSDSYQLQRGKANPLW